MSTPPPETKRLRVFRLGEEPTVDPYILSLSVSERMEMAWELSRQAWLMMGADPDAPFVAMLDALSAERAESW